MEHGSADDGTRRPHILFLQPRIRDSFRPVFDALGGEVDLRLLVLTGPPPLAGRESFDIERMTQRWWIRRLLKALRRLEREPCDGIVVPGPFTREYPVVWLWSRLLGIPVIVFGQEWAPRGPSSLRRLLRPWIATLLRSTAAGIVPGQRSREFLIWCGLPAERIHVAPGVGPIAVREPPRPPSASQDILFVGRLIRVKAVDVLLRAFGTLERDLQAVLRIAGEGPERGRLEALAASLGIADRVVFEGWIPQERLAALYATARAVVLPSRFDPSGREQFEVWGYVLSEAAQFGRPLVATDMVGGAADLIRDGWNGYLVHAEDVEALARALGSLSSDSAAADRMGEASRALAHRMGVAAFVQGFVEAITQAVETHTEGGP